MTAPRSPLPDSYRPELADEVAGPLDPATEFEVTLVLRRRAEPPEDAFAGPPLTAAELAERYGADPADVDAVRSAVQDAGATIVSADAGSRTVRVRGRADVLSELFGTTLHATTAAAPGSRRRSGQLSLPHTLAGPVSAVLGLDDRPQARGRFAVASGARPDAGYTPLQLAAAYDFPDGDGSGQTIAIVELGGGYRPDDLDTYFTGLKLTTPKVTSVSVDGAKNGGGTDPSGADGEVLLDIEVAGALAPKADVLVYFAPNTDDGFVDAITRAAHATPTPTAISISWGQSEDQWSAQGRTSLDSACADAALLGVTVTAAAGDNGSSDTPTGATARAGAVPAAAAAVHVDFPASSPHVLGCGGTSLQLTGAGAVTSETVWNGGSAGGATGGGVSDHFALPSWQRSAGVPDRSGGPTSGRGVPDVAGDADPETGYRVLVDGTASVIGGTSAVAPLWAGLVARLAQSLGTPLGLLQPKIYKGVAPGATTPGFRDITEGSNGAYSAAAGWDACTGLGVPSGTALLKALGG